MKTIKNCILLILLAFIISCNKKVDESNFINNIIGKALISSAQRSSFDEFYTLTWNSENSEQLHNKLLIKFKKKGFTDGLKSLSKEDKDYWKILSKGINFSKQNILTLSEKNLNLSLEIVKFPDDPEFGVVVLTVLKNEPTSQPK